MPRVSSKSTAPARPSMAWRVVDAQHAFDHAVAKGAEPYDGADKTLDVPAIVGIGGSLIYFIDQYYEHDRPITRNSTGSTRAQPEGVGFYYLDHLTHNVFKGNMDKWFQFYGDLFNFREIRFFDIEGKFTGLFQPRADLALRPDPHSDQRGPGRERARSWPI